MKILVVKTAFFSGWGNHIFLRWCAALMVLSVVLAKRPCFSSQHEFITKYLPESEKITFF